MVGVLVVAGWVWSAEITPTNRLPSGMMSWLRSSAGPPVPQSSGAGSFDFSQIFSVKIFPLMLPGMSH